MKIKLIPTLLLAAALLTGCGDGHQAKSVINDFIDANLPGERKQVVFLRLDSTRFVKADDVAAMRKNKPGAPYSNVKLPGKLLFMTTRFTDEKGNARQQTFYLNEDLTGIVCFKEN